MAFIFYSVELETFGAGDRLRDVDRSDLPLVVDLAQDRGAANDFGRAVGELPIKHGEEPAAVAIIISLGPALQRVCGGLEPQALDTFIQRLINLTSPPEWTQ